MSSVIRSTRPRLVLALGFAVASFVSAPAEASQSFPSTVMAEYDMPCPPSCTLCHATDPGQNNNFIKPFALAVLPRSGGGLAGNQSKLEAALALIRTEALDTDGDQTSDYDELHEGLDPNKAGDARLCGPAYGCGAHIAKAPAKNGSAWLFAVGAAALVTFGFRRRRSS